MTDSYYCTGCGRLYTSILDFAGCDSITRQALLEDPSGWADRPCSRCASPLAVDRRNRPLPVASTKLRRPHWWDPDGRQSRRDVVEGSQEGATLSALRRALRGCPACDWDEAEGGLVSHCVDCQHRVTTIAFGLFGEG